MLHLIRSSLAAALILTSACATETDDLVADRAAAVSASAEAGLLALLADDATSLQLLDVGCAIRSDSARNLIAHRDGADGIRGTADDDPFDSYAEVDDVRMVGPWTLRRLTMCAWLFGHMRGVGPALAGRGSAAINGVASPGEWAAAATHGLDVALPGGGSAPATLHVMNDDDQLYLAIALDGDLLGRMVRFTALFDDDGNGLADPGEDRIAAVWHPSSSTTAFGDAHVGERLPRAGDVIASSYYDTARGGSAEGTAATAHAGGQTVIELAHPLDSADDAHDLSLAPGDEVDFSFAVAVLGDRWVESRSWATLVVAGADDATPTEVPWTLPDDVLATVAARAETHRDPSSPFSVRLAEQLAYVIDGAPIGYRVVFVQTIDPEGGIQLVIELELDADYTVTAERAYI